MLVFGYDGKFDGRQLNPPFLSLFSMDVAPYAAPAITKTTTRELQPASHHAQALERLLAIGGLPLQAPRQAAGARPLRGDVHHRAVDDVAHPRLLLGVAS